MKRHVNYLKYVIRHKWFVFIASRKVKCSLFRALVHDLSKFLPSEWFPYAWTFYRQDGSKRYCPTPEFDMAWNHHQKRNKHHYQYYILQEDSGDVKVLKIPVKYVKEMVADWMGAGKAITGKWEVKEWYKKNKNKMVMHNESRHLVEQILRGLR